MKLLSPSTLITMPPTFITNLLTPTIIYSSIAIQPDVRTWDLMPNFTVFAESAVIMPTLLKSLSICLNFSATPDIPIALPPLLLNMWKPSVKTLLFNLLPLMMISTAFLWSWHCTPSILLFAPGGVVFQAGYPRKRTYKTDPQYVFYRYENRP